MKTWIMEHQGISAFIALAFVAGVIWLIVYLTSDDEAVEAETKPKPKHIGIAETEAMTRITPNQYRTAMARGASAWVMPTLSGGSMGGRRVSPVKS